MSVLIIAEAGVNHNGDLAVAERLVDVAADAGADYVKFQTFSARRLVTTDAPKAEYQQQAGGTLESQYEMLRRLELDRTAHERLLDRCRARGIGFLSTGFDDESIEMLLSLGIDRLKVPSGELTNLPYLEFVGKQRKDVILSTGMATLEEVGEALEVLERAGSPRERVTVLHCNTEYPTPMSDVNLRAMVTIREAFGVAVGYSDHTLGIEVAIAAVALGAKVIEKHFTLDRGMTGPDHRASMEPAELAAMVTAIRNIEKAMGDGHKRPSPSESRNRDVARRSLVAAVPIRKGELFTMDKLTAKRPGNGIAPMRLPEVIGRPAPRDFAADELIEL